MADRTTKLNLLEQLNGYTFLSGVLGKDANEAGVSGDAAEHFVLIPLKNPDETGLVGYQNKLG